MNILVCDDDQRLCDEIVGNIEESTGETPTQLVGQKLSDVLIKFFKDIKACLSADDPHACLPLASNPFDEKIVILDNNLTLLEVMGAPLTAESIAGYLRAFTKADYIISLNLNSDVDFDLRYLVGDYSTRADLALNTSHLANRALWTGEMEDAKDGFLPWYWPRLNTVVVKRREQIQFVRDRLNMPVLDSLGFDKDRTALLSAHALGALSPKAELDGVQSDSVAPGKISFKDVFIARDRSLPVRRERDRLATGIANDAIQDIVARTVAADIEYWFRRDIIGPQDPLVDLPHLLMRLPFLLGKKARTREGWNSCLKLRQPPYGLDHELYANHLKRRTYLHDLWVPRPCFWWHELKNDAALSDIFFAAAQGDWADVVFCEDLSLFSSNQEHGKEPPIEFPAEFEGAWARRNVAYVSGYQYAPRSRLAS